MGKLANLALDSLPTFKCLIPSTGKTVTMRSFVVKEQKLLLIAKQSDTDQMESITGAVVQLIQNCDVNNELDVSTLPSFDIEYIFIQLFKHSVGTSKSKVFYRCLNPVLDNDGNPVIVDDEPKVCGTTNGIIVDLSTAVVKASEIKSGIIDIKSKTLDTIVLRYPTFDQIVRHDVALAADDVAGTFSVYGECLQYVYKADGTQLVYGEDYDVDDAIEMIELLSQSVYEQLIDFFNTAPSVTATTGFTCKECGHKTEINLRGLSDFF